MSGKKYPSNGKLGFADFLYLSTRLKALEAKNMTYDRYEKMIEAKNIAEAASVLTECEYGSGSPSGESSSHGDGIEKLFSEELKKHYDLILAHSPDSNMVNFFLYFYDCHNLKSLIKSEFLGSGATDVARLFIDSCTIPYETAVSAVRDRDFSCYMENVAAAAPEIIESYALNRDPMIIDVDFDRAMYADLDRIVRESRIKTDYLRRYFARKADLVNIITTVRILRLGYSQVLLSRALVPGGSIGAEFFTSKYESGETEFLESLRFTPYFALSSEETSLSKLEKTADELLIALVDEVKFSPFGPESILAFIISKENEVRNVRVILSGKAASLTAENIRERLRTVYV